MTGCTSHLAEHNRLHSMPLNGWTCTMYGVQRTHECAYDPISCSLTKYRVRRQSWYNRAREMPLMLSPIVPESHELCFARCLLQLLLMMMIGLFFFWFLVYAGNVSTHISILRLIWWPNNRIIISRFSVRLTLIGSRRNRSKWIFRSSRVVMIASKLNDGVIHCELKMTVNGQLLGIRTNVILSLRALCTNPLSTQHYHVMTSTRLMISIVISRRTARNHTTVQLTITIHLNLSETKSCDIVRLKIQTDRINLPHP